MRALRCLLGHKPYIDESECWIITDPGDLAALASYAGSEKPPVRAVVGPIRRYCGRCGVTLPGAEVQVGDRIRSQVR